MEHLGYYIILPKITTDIGGVLTIPSKDLNSGAAIRSSHQQIHLAIDQEPQLGKPSGKQPHKLWKIVFFYGKIHYKWQFSMSLC